MNIHVKTALTLAVLVVLVLLGVTWGWSALLSPFPHRAAQKACYPTRLRPGDRVSPPKVIVSVFNASQRVGLASATMTAFQDQGFGAGSIGNAPQGAVVHYAQIWTTDRTSPAVQLVASRLGPHASIVNKKHRGPGVVVMVGPQFAKLVQGRPSTKVTQPVTLCEPPTG
jgi:hypothetical protein